MLDATLRFLSSVKVGVFLLAVLIVASVLGTVIIQKGTSGFTEYYASLLPAERELYEFLGLLDIYHTRWFNLLLLTVSLNIVLASIDYFPAAWRYVRKPVVKINQAFVSRQPFQHVAYVMEAETAVQALKARAAQELRPLAHRWLPISAVYRVVETVNPRDGSTTILTEAHAWNRLTAYAVHAALLTIFGGALVGGLFGHKGTVRMVPGQSANTFVSFGAPDEPAQEFAMPFTLVCTDIEQNLLDPRKPDLSAPNTLDWHTRAIIRDEQRGVEVPAHIHLNHPFDYRGYRFFSRPVLTTSAAPGPSTSNFVRREVRPARPISLGVSQPIFPDWGASGWRISFLMSPSRADAWGAPAANTGVRSPFSMFLATIRVSSMRFRPKPSKPSAMPRFSRPKRKSVTCGLS